MNGFVFGSSDAAARLRGKAPLAAAAFSVVAVLFGAWLARRFTPDDAADVALGGVVFGFALPLVAYAAVGRVCGGGRLDDAVRPLARHGANRRGAVLGAIFAAAVRVSALGAAFGFLGVLVARSHGGAAATFADAFTSAWIGALGGAVYVAWFGLGSLFGKAGSGRAVALALDWIFGPSASALAMPWPRAHLRSLLGGELVLGLPEWQSTVALYALALVYVALVGLRVAK